MSLRKAVFGLAMGLAVLAYTPVSLLAQEAWSYPPGEYQRDFDRQAFHDGIEGVRKDFQNRRRPDVNNRHEYLHPHVPPYERGAYQEAFRRGYDVGVQHIYFDGGPR
jgi:hypothetical protein